MGKNLEYSITRNNIRIILDNENPKVDIGSFDDNISDEDAVIRVIFTLTGTREELTFLKYLRHFSNVPDHYGYTSIGRIEECGKCCDFGEKGSYIVIPAQYSKYILVGKSDFLNMNRVLYKVVPGQTDMVNTLFYPILCLALKLLSQIDDPQRGSIIFFGCNIVGTVFLKLLIMEGINPILFLDNEDINEELLASNGADRVIKKTEEINEEIIAQVSKAFVFSTSSLISDIINTKLPKNVSIINPEDLDSENESYPWMSYDIHSTALDLISSGEICFKDLISQHVHAETVYDTCEWIKRGRYKGKTIVYDW